MGKSVPNSSHGVPGDKRMKKEEVRERVIEHTVKNWMELSVGGDMLLTKYRIGRLGLCVFSLKMKLRTSGSLEDPVAPRAYTARAQSLTWHNGSCLDFEKIN